MYAVGLLITGALLLHGQADLTPPIIGDLRSGNYVQAANRAEAALQKAPADPRLWTLDGVARARSGDAERAAAAYKRALQLAPDYLPALEGAAEIAYKRGSGEAVPLLENILRLRPADRTSHAMLGAIAAKKRDCRTAAAEFEKSEPVIESQPSALEEYGACLVRLDKTREAVPVFRRLSELRPDDIKSTYNLAVVESLAGQNAAVISSLTPLTAAESADPEILALLAEAYEGAGDTPKAVELLHRAIVAAPDTPRFYVAFASISLVHASYQVGIDMLNAGLQRLPRAAALYLARGILYIQLGEYSKSENDFNQAENLDPEEASASVARGMAALQQNKLLQAESTLRERIKKQPDSAFLRYLLAEAIVRKGAAPGSPEFQEAMSAAAKSVQLQPDFALGRDVLGRLYLQQGKNRQALEQSRLAFQYDPSDQTALYHLIVALKKDGQTAQIPELTRQLTKIREEARKRESSEHKYALIEQGANQIPNQN